MLSISEVNFLFTYAFKLIYGISWTTFNNEKLNKVTFIDIFAIDIILAGDGHVKYCNKMGIYLYIYYFYFYYFLNY